MKRPGASGADMKTPPAGVSTTAWLMLHVPRISDACPGRVTPAPTALAITSKKPATTGVPAASPVRAAAVRGHPSDDLDRPVQLRQQPFRVGQSIGSRAGRRHRRWPATAAAPHRPCRRRRWRSRRSAHASPDPCTSGHAPPAPSPRADAAPSMQAAPASAPPRAFAGRSRSAASATPLSLPSSTSPAARVSSDWIAATGAPSASSR